MSPGTCLYILFYLFSFPVPPHWFGFFFLCHLYSQVFNSLLSSTFAVFFSLTFLYGEHLTHHFYLLQSIMFLEFFIHLLILSSLLPKVPLHRGWVFCLFVWLVGYLLFLLQWRRYSFCSADSVWKDYWSLEVSWRLSERLIWVYSQLSHSFSPQGTSVL